MANENKEKTAENAENPVKIRATDLEFFGVGSLDGNTGVIEHDGLFPLHVHRGLFHRCGHLSVISSPGSSGTGTLTVRGEGSSARRGTLKVEVLGGATMTGNVTVTDAMVSANTRKVTFGKKGRPAKFAGIEVRLIGEFVGDLEVLLPSKNASRWTVRLAGQELELVEGEPSTAPVTYRITAEGLILTVGQPRPSRPTRSTKH